MTTTPYKRQAFTLVELLVVISIIALLISILLPALKSARTAAYASTSLSNVRQLMLAIHSYAADNKSSLPYSAFGVTGGGNPDDPFWGQALYDMNYVNGSKIFWAPDRNAKDLSNDSSGDQGKFTGYGTNTYGPMTAKAYDWRDTGDGPLLPYRLGVIGGTKNPSLGKDAQQLVLLEVMTISRFPDEDGSWYCTPGASDVIPITRNGGVAQGYLDGHGSGGSSQMVGWTATGMRSGSWESGLSFTNEKGAMAPWFSRYNTVWNLKH